MIAIYNIVIGLYLLIAVGLLRIDLDMPGDRRRAWLRAVGWPVLAAMMLVGLCAWAVFGPPRDRSAP